jgi:hypothetical protein
MWVFRENMAKGYSIGYFQDKKFITILVQEKLKDAVAVCSYLNGGQRPIWF